MACRPSLKEHDAWGAGGRARNLVGQGVGVDVGVGVRDGVRVGVGVYVGKGVAVGCRVGVGCELLQVIAV